MDSAGAIAGPLAALVLLARFGIRSVFWAAAIPGALCVMVALFGIRETKNPYFSQKTRETGHSRHSSDDSNRKPAQKASADSLTFRNRLPGAFYFVLVAVTLFSLGNSSDMFLVMRAQNVGIPVALAPLLGLVFNLTYTLGSWPAGWFSDRFSRRWIPRAKPSW